MNQSNTSIRSRNVMIGAIAGVVVLIVGIVAWRASAERVPSPDAPGSTIQKFVASDKFNELPAEQKQQYVQKMFEADPEREKAMRNMAMAHRQKMLDDYFALPEGKARRDYLDQRIDDMEQMRKRMENPSTQPGDGKIVIRRGGPGAAAQKEMTETIPAEYQGKMAQYMKDLKDRRAERGLPTDGPAGGFVIRIGGPN